MRCCFWKLLRILGTFSCVILAAVSFDHCSSYRVRCNLSSLTSLCLIGEQLDYGLLKFNQSWSTWSLWKQIIIAMTHEEKRIKLAAHYLKFGGSHQTTTPCTAPQSGIKNRKKVSFEEICCSKSGLFFKNCNSNFFKSLKSFNPTFLVMWLFVDKDPLCIVRNNFNLNDSWISAWMGHKK